MQTGRCTAITRSGERCTHAATGPHGFCWNHDPENAEKRRRTASRAARAKSLTEVKELKAEIKELIAEVRSGELDRNQAAVMLQGYRTLKDYVELERRVKETDELTAEIEELKRARDDDHSAA